MENCVNRNKISFTKFDPATNNDAITKTFQRPQEKQSSILVHHTYSKFNGTDESQCSVINNVTSSLKPFTYNFKNNNGKVIVKSVKITPPTESNDNSIVNINKPKLLTKQISHPIIDLTEPSQNDTAPKTVLNSVRNGQVQTNSNGDKLHPNILIPFKKRLNELIHKNDNGIIDKPQFAPPKNVSSGPSKAEVKSKIEAWNADFQRAYRNEYENFDESLELEEIITQEKSTYQKLQESKLNEARRTFKLPHKVIKNDFTDSKLVKESPEKVHIRKSPLECRITNDYLEIPTSPQRPPFQNANNYSNHSSSYCNENSTTESTNGTNRINDQDDQSVISISSDSDKEINENQSKKSNETISTPKRKRPKFKPASPLSPETKKRNEFYSYLKISTKPPLRSDGTPVTPNRRSIRVRNLESKKRERSPSNDRSSITTSSENCENQVQNKKINKTKSSLSQSEINKIFAKPKLVKPIQINKSLNDLSDQKQLLNGRRQLMRNKEIAAKQFIVRRFLTRRRPFMLLRSKAINKANYSIRNQKTLLNKKKFLLNNKNSETPDESILTNRFIGFTYKEQLYSRKYKQVFRQFYKNTETMLTELKPKQIEHNKEKLKKPTTNTSQLVENEKIDQRSIISSSDTKSVKKPSKYLNKSKLVINRISGIATRSSSIIDRIITRSIQAKNPNFNLNNVLTRIQNKDLRLIFEKKSKHNSSSSSISQSSTSSLPNDSTAYTEINDHDSLVTLQKKYNNIMKTVSEINPSKSNIDQSDGVCSNISSSNFEYDFHGFETESVHPNNSCNVDKSNLLINLSRCKRRYSLPTYLSNEKTLNLQRLLSTENQSISSVAHSENEMQVFQNTSHLQTNSNETENTESPNIFNIDTLEQTQQPTFIPLITQPNRTFNQTFFNTKSNSTKPSSPCIFGTETTSQYCSLWDDENSQNNLTVYSSILEQDNLSFLSRSDQKHAIDISELQGNVISMQFVANTLIVVQESLISFWQQTPLGTILGAQNMWLCLGKVQRLKLDQGCEIKRTHSRNVISVENAIAYTELWIKEHSSERRVVTVSDIFVVIYFYFYNKKGSSGLDKKVLQLENIKGYAHDVQYITMENSRSIVACWRDHFGDPHKTIVRRYVFAPDFQTVTTVAALESIDHYVISLHNVFDCHDMVIGVGHQCVSVWHILYGKLITTVEIIPAVEYPTVAQFSDINCVWALCDRGFLFLLQKTDHNHLQLIAINGLRNDWKQLKLYRVPSEYTNLRGVSVEGGVLCACYDNGLVCWTLQTGVLLLQCPSGDHISVYPSQSHILFIDQTFNVGAKHITAFLLLLSCRLA